MKPVPSCQVKVKVGDAEQTTEWKEGFDPIFEQQFTFPGRYCEAGLCGGVWGDQEHACLHVLGAISHAALVLAGCLAARSLVMHILHDLLLPPLLPQLRTRRPPSATPPST